MNKWCSAHIHNNIFVSLGFALFHQSVYNTWVFIMPDFLISILYPRSGTKFPSFLYPLSISILKTKTWKQILFKELKCSAFNHDFSDRKEDGKIKK